MVQVNNKSVIAKYYNHIDNGGVEVQVEAANTDEGTISTCITFSTQYYGYPNVVSSLNIFDTDKVTAKEYLLGLSQMFEEAAMKIDKK